MPFASIVRDFARMLEGMHAEAGHNADLSPLDPNYEQYLALDASGALRTLAVRRDGRLIGFALCTIGPHLDHVSTLWGSLLKIYIVPKQRRGMIGQRLFRAVEQRMRQEGVVLLTAAARLQTNPRGRTVASLLDFNGFDPIETVYVKRLE